ncbi:hypothetical protein STIAU_8325 [Stigmatella aurantiaca DW4/3-1]|uniref:Uncharacterized protein n=1 Tax=Stigmatella aurantiaca (strain DW4/3-1) TaxID=378806 RepID=Q09EB7_STIAD|nr:hypothetical protein STIAU_8325 [Stigmatella aurantiaca DW4/3-1]
MPGDIGLRQELVQRPHVDGLAEHGIHQRQGGAVLPPHIHARDNGQQRLRRALAKLARQIPTRDVRHHRVQQRGVIAAPLPQLKGHLRVLGQLHVIALFAQHLRHHPGVVQVVVHHQHPARLLEAAGPLRASAGGRLLLVALPQPGQPHHEGAPHSPLDVLHRQLAAPAAHLVLHHRQLQRGLGGSRLPGERIEQPRQRLHGERRPRVLDAQAQLRVAIPPGDQRQLPRVLHPVPGRQQQGHHQLPQKTGIHVDLPRVLQLQLHLQGGIAPLQFPAHQLQGLAHHRVQHHVGEVFLGALHVELLQPAHQIADLPHRPVQRVQVLGFELAAQQRDAQAHHVEEVVEGVRGAAGELPQGLGPGPLEQLPLQPPKLILRGAQLPGLLGGLRAVRERLDDARQLPALFPDGGGAHLQARRAAAGALHLHHHPAHGPTLLERPHEGHVRHPEGLARGVVRVHLGQHRGHRGEGPRAHHRADRHPQQAADRLRGEGHAPIQLGQQDAHVHVVQHGLHHRRLAEAHRLGPQHPGVGGLGGGARLADQLVDEVRHFRREVSPLAARIDAHQHRFERLELARQILGLEALVIPECPMGADHLGPEPQGVFPPVMEQAHQLVQELAQGGPEVLSRHLDFVQLFPQTLGPQARDTLALLLEHLGQSLDGIRVTHRQDFNLCTAGGLGQRGQAGRQAILRPGFCTGGADPTMERQRHATHGTRQERSDAAAHLRYGDGAPLPGRAGPF